MNLRLTKSINTHLDLNKIQLNCSIMIQFNIRRLRTIEISDDSIEYKYQIINQIV